MSTQLTPFPEDYSYVYKEAEKEEQALAMLYGSNPTDAARSHGIPESIEVTPKSGRDKGKKVQIRIADVLKALPKFFKKKFDKKEPDLIHLTQIADDIAEKFKTWLLNDYTERYQAIDTSEKLEWLDIITLMVVTHYIQECKYRGYALYGRKTFANHEVRKELTRLKIANSMTQKAAEGANHVVKVRTIGGNVDEEVKKLRDDIVSDVDTKVKQVHSDNPPPFIEQYRKEQKKLKQDNLQIEEWVVNE